VVVVPARRVGCHARRDIERFDGESSSIHANYGNGLERIPDPVADEGDNLVAEDFSNMSNSVGDGRLSLAVEGLRLEGKRAIYARSMAYSL
jgi:hypothetical protein